VNKVREKAKTGLWALIVAALFVAGVSCSLMFSVDDECDNDNDCDFRDATYIKRYLVGMGFINVIPPTWRDNFVDWVVKEQKFKDYLDLITSQDLIDIDGDGKQNYRDAVFMVRRIVGMGFISITPLGWVSVRPESEMSTRLNELSGAPSGRGGAGRSSGGRGETVGTVSVGKLTHPHLVASRFP